MIKKFACMCLAAGLLFNLSAAALADDPPEMTRWIKTNSFSDRDENQRLDIKVIYYSNEYINALVNNEAEKNLWTRDELENYKYSLLKQLNLYDEIVFYLSLDVTGVPIYAQPFDRHISLMVGNKRYTPSDYDKRFNFKIIGPRDGLISFNRYDDKGKAILDGAKDVRLVFDAAVSQAVSARGNVMWVWDITKDRDDALGGGKAMDRLEADRLIRRLDKLNQQRKDLQTKLDEIDREMSDVNKRVDELQGN